MGTTITPEILTQIQSKKVINSKNNIILNDKKYNEKAKRPKLKEIIKNIYFPDINRNIKEKEKLIEEIKNNENNNKNSKIDNNNNDMNINDIIFRNHKSIDLSYNFFKNNDDILKLENSERDDLNSVKSNKSINSDYEDISNEILYFNKNIQKNKKEKIKIINNIKVIKAKNIRDSYYNKLISKCVWNPLIKERVFNNLFFFDWDDTLLCTSYLQPTGAFIDMEINKRDKEIISNLDSLVSKLLIKTMNIGIVFIITNGAPGWVELSSTKFYPKTSKILQKIKVVSARGLCEKKYPGDMRQWKSMAFKYALDSINDINKNIPTNIICFGDSIIEMEASYNLKEYFSNAYLKTIKFKESPTHTELEKELKIISTQLDTIMSNNDKNLSIKVTRKKPE